MRYRFQQLLLCGTIVLASLYSKAQAPALTWQLVKDKDGIKVYTANAASSSLKYIKVEAILDGTVDKFSTVFRDVPNQTKDRKSTRLNSSHVEISYAVFC